jgi:hypothetical protein
LAISKGGDISILLAVALHTALLINMQERLQKQSACKLTVLSISVVAGE